MSQLETIDIEDGFQLGMDAEGERTEDVLLKDCRAMPRVGKLRRAVRASMMTEWTTLRTDAMGGRGNESPEGSWWRGARICEVVN